MHGYVSSSLLYMYMNNMKKHAIYTVIKGIHKTQNQLLCKLYTQYLKNMLLVTAKVLGQE